jgi:hypothetical protein
MARDWAKMEGKGAVAVAQTVDVGSRDTGRNICAS